MRQPVDDAPDHVTIQSQLGLTITTALYADRKRSTDRRGQRLPGGSARSAPISEKSHSHWEMLTSDNVRLHHFASFTEDGLTDALLSHTQAFALACRCRRICLRRTRRCRVLTRRSTYSRSCPSPRLEVLLELRLNSHRVCSPHTRSQLLMQNVIQRHYHTTMYSPPPLSTSTKLLFHQQTLRSKGK